MAALETALDYIGRGWSPIPVGHREKRPKLEGWPTLRLGAEDAGRYFNGAAHNIGILLGPASGGLTDVDLDCSEAVGVGSYFLPPTDAIFGRASKRNSHFLYFTGIAASGDRAAIQFQDPTLPQDDKNMLLEVRIGGGGRGAQTVFPGSTHAGGEEIRWETDGVPAKVEDADLMKAAHRIAAASLFIRGMPGSGSRHGAFCAIGGFLARCGLTGPIWSRSKPPAAVTMQRTQLRLIEAASAATATRQSPRSSAKKSPRRPLNGWATSPVPGKRTTGRLGAGPPKPTSCSNWPNRPSCFILRTEPVLPIYMSMGIGRPGASAPRTSAVGSCAVSSKRPGGRQVQRPCKTP